MWVKEVVGGGRRGGRNRKIIFLKSDELVAFVFVFVFVFVIVFVFVFFVSSQKS